LWYVAGQIYILPQHLWSTVGDASQYADPNPIGTGPYVLGSFTPQLEVLTRNDKFWQPGKPAVKELRFPAFSSNVSAELVLNSGNLDWTGLYTPDIQRTYIARDAQHNHYWFPPSDIVMLYVNLAKAPFNNLAVRQAMSDAIDRTQLYHVAESGYEPPASPTGLVLPADNSYVAPQYANSTFHLDPAKAISLLQGAGYTKGSDGVFADTSGKKLSFNLDVISGYTDWITSCQIIASDLKAIGMNVTVNTISYDAFYNALQVGNYDTAIWGTNAGPSPYFIYDSLLRSDNTAPIGQAANSNFERWVNPATDTLLQQYAATADPAAQQQAIAGLETIMVNNLPSIPLMNEPYWYEFNTSRWTGWPDASHPYAEPSPYTYPDSEIVILHLQPAS
jgi:peptide/nickel transport system substrate-binding protein